MYRSKFNVAINLRHKLQLKTYKVILPLFLLPTVLQLTTMGIGFLKREVVKPLLFPFLFSIISALPANITYLRVAWKKSRYAYNISEISSLKVHQ